MILHHAFVLAAAAVLALHSQASADYMADFDTTGSAADFAAFQINATDDGDPSGTGDDTDFFEVTLGDDALRTQASPPAGGSGPGGNQLRYQVAPSNALNPGVLIPVGSSGNAVRTEARLKVTVEDIIGGDDLPIENPFMQLGFAEFDPGTSTPDYATKVIVQIDNAFNAGTAADPHRLDLSETGNNAGAGNFNINAYDIPGDAFSPGAVIELVLTETEAKVIYNGTDFGFESLPANFFANFIAPGNQLIPFFGVIRGPALEDGDVVAAVFDNIMAKNVTVIPEPTSLAICLVAGFMGLAYGRRRRVGQAKS